MDRAGFVVSELCQRAAISVGCCTRSGWCRRPKWTPGRSASGFGGRGHGLLHAVVVVRAEVAASTTMVTTSPIVPLPSRNAGLSKPVDPLPWQRVASRLSYRLAFGQTDPREFRPGEL